MDISFAALSTVLIRYFVLSADETQLDRCFGCGVIYQRIREIRDPVETYCDRVSQIKSYRYFKFDVCLTKWFTVRSKQMGFGKLMILGRGGGWKLGLIRY